MPYVIAAPCIDVMDKSCFEECPVDCIYEGERKLYINAKECIDCGACEPVCPVEAISQDRRVPDDMTDHVQDNIRFFTEVLPGAPSGSHVTGAIGVDTPLVAGQ
jgi:NAD-dependent dihydropyrimidine dehydrogenase PreA subunit